MAKKKVVIDLNLFKISDDVLHKKANDNTTLEEFQKEVKRHERVKKKIE